MENSDNNVKNYIVDSKNVENIENSDNTVLSGKEKSLLNLKPLNQRSQEERRQIASLGGKAKALKDEKQRTMQESAKALLKTVVRKEYAKKVLGEDADISGIETMQDLLVAKMMQETLENGNAKAFELIRDTSGNKPTADVKITADVVTASDRALIEKVADRLGVVDIKDENDD